MHGQPVAAGLIEKMLAYLKNNLLQKVREVYLKFVDKGELVRIDGDKPKDVVADLLYAKVLALLKTVKGVVS